MAVTRRLARWTCVSVAILVVAGAGGYGTYVTAAYRDYGNVGLAPIEDYDELLQQFMPADDVVERHHVTVAAPASTVFAAAADQDLLQMADQFAAFNEPGYVKIVWTLRADPWEGGSVFRTETRAVATDAVAREKFRRYWSFLSPGIVLIRRLSAAQLQAEAVRQAALPTAELRNPIRSR